MKPLRIGKQFAAFLESAFSIARTVESDAIMIMVDGPTEWDKLKELVGERRVLIVADSAEELEGAVSSFPTIVVGMPEAPIQERLAQAMIEAVADDYLHPNSSVIAVYSAYDGARIDSLSFVRLHEHLGRLTSRDLQKIETSVPLETLKSVVDLAVEIGREGRESKKVGTIFVVGDTRKVLQQTHEGVWDPAKGQNRKERSLSDARAREAVKEIAQMDGAFVIATDGVVEACCRIIVTPDADITLSPGLGSRHLAAALISKNTNALAIVVSESSGTVRVFQDGGVILRIEPFRRAMKWKDDEMEKVRDEEM